MKKLEITNEELGTLLLSLEDRISKLEVWFEQSNREDSWCAKEKEIALKLHNKLTRI